MVICLGQPVQMTVSDVELGHVFVQSLENGLCPGHSLSLLGLDQLSHLQALPLYGAGQLGEDPLAVFPRGLR